MNMQSTRLLRALLALLLCCALSMALAQAATSVPERDGPRVEQRMFPSEAMDAAIGYHVYLPEAYIGNPARAFPVVYWLHGSGGFPPGVINMLAGRFDSAIRAGTVPAMLVVFSNGLGESMWVDSKDGRVPMESIVVRELVPHIDAEFRTVASAEGRIVEGGSMGGYGAARLGFKYPEMFGAVSMLNPGPMQEVLDVDDAPIAGASKAQAVLDRVYGGDVAYFRSQSPWVLAEQNATAIRGRVRVRLIVGAEDPSLENNRRFSEHLTDLGIAHAFEVLPGVGHSPRSLFPALGDGYWEFFRRFPAESEDQ